MLFRGDILTLLASPSMQWITLVSALTALPTEIELLLLFAMDRVTRRIVIVRLLVPCQPILLDQFEVLSCTVQCDWMQNVMCVRSTTVSLNIIFL